MISPSCPSCLSGRSCSGPTPCSAYDPRPGTYSNKPGRLKSGPGRAQAPGTEQQASARNGAATGTAHQTSGRTRPGQTQNHVQVRPWLQAPSLSDLAATYAYLRLPTRHTILVMLLAVLLLLVMLLPIAGRGAWNSQAGESGPTVLRQPQHNILLQQAVIPTTPKQEPGPDPAAPQSMTTPQPTVTRPAAAEPHPGPPATSRLDSALGEALTGQVI